MKNIYKLLSLIVILAIIISFGLFIYKKYKAKTSVDKGKRIYSEKIESTPETKLNKVNQNVIKEESKKEDSGGKKPVEKREEKGIQMIEDKRKEKEIQKPEELSFQVIKKELDDLRHDILAEVQGRTKALEDKIVELDIKNESKKYSGSKDTTIIVLFVFLIILISLSYYFLYLPIKNIEKNLTTKNEYLLVQLNEIRKALEALNSKCNSISIEISSIPNKISVETQKEVVYQVVGMVFERISQAITKSSNAPFIPTYETQKKYPPSFIGPQEEITVSYIRDKRIFKKGVGGAWRLVPLGSGKYKAEIIKRRADDYRYGFFDIYNTKDPYPDLENIKILKEPILKDISNGLYELLEKGEAG